mmetsp:Transcript_33877/g.32970  ORF Transcript_33877/g.32970 Transcript_33877/m.32970 type:complete len:89 (-) Transcript_33877:1186-1452(-)
MRFARTYFLQNLSRHYMQGIYYTDDDDLRIQRPQGRINELNANLLMTTYLALIQTFNNTVEAIFKSSREEQKVVTLEKESFGQFEKMF